MREIKFRGWVKSSNKMLPVYDLGLSNVDQYTIGIADCGDLNCGLCVDYYEKHEVEVMQYTGLKDKNGREIYEGDIVAYDSERALGNVIYKDGGFYVEEDRAMLAEWKIADDIIDVKVVGHIYVKPELLEGDSQ